MKKLLIILAIIVVVVAGIFVSAAMNADKLVNKFKPDLERIASGALGSKVTLGKLETSVFPEVKVRVGELRLEGGSAQEAFTLNNLLLHVKLLPLLSGSLDIKKLSIDKPEVVFTKSKEGVQVVGLPKKKAAAAPAPQPAPTAKEGAALPSALKLNLERFEIIGAKVTFKDEEAKKEYQVSQIDVGAAVALKENVVSVPDLSVSARVLNKAALKIHGAGITYGLADGKARVPELQINLLGNVMVLKAAYDTKTSEGSVSIDSAGVSLASLDPLLDIAPQARAFELKGAIKPALSAQLNPAGFSADGAISLSGLAAKAADMQISDLSGAIKIAATPALQNASSEGLTLALNGAPLKIMFDAGVEGGTLAKLHRLTIEAFAGSVNAAAQAQLGGAQSFSSKIDVKGIKIQDALAAVKPAVAQMVSGTLSGLSADVNGSLGPTLMQSLKGSARVLAENCTLNGVNLAGDVLKALNQIPTVQGSLYSSVPPEQQASVASNNTAIRSLSGDFQIGGGTLATPNLKLLSDVFSLASDGKVGFDSSLDLNATISFTQAFSASLVARTPEIKKILDSNGQLTVPLSIRGTPPKVMVLPNAQRLIEMAGKKALQEQGTKLLDNVLGGKGKKGGGKGFSLGF